MAEAEVLTLSVNGERRTVAARAQSTLLEVLREDLGLTGTKRACDDASCGACTVWIEREAGRVAHDGDSLERASKPASEGQPALACISLALTCEGALIRTVEGVCRDPSTANVQQALVQEGGLQCGFCTPGIVLAAHALLRETPRPQEAEIRRGLSGNLCRCTGYVRIVQALRRAVERR